MINMSQPLVVLTDRLSEILCETELPERLHGCELVAVSGVLQTSLEQPRFQAVRDTLRASAEARVSHIVMLDSHSDKDAFAALEEVGAIVINIDHGTEGGLAKPYVMAAQLIELCAPEAVMVKFEGEKPLFEHERNVDVILTACKVNHIVTGERSEDTWASMPPFQVQTEYPLGYVIGELLGISFDTPSGIIAMNSDGRRLFVEWVGVNDWSYLFTIPYRATKNFRYNVGTVEVNFRYHHSVVTEETNNSAFNGKRMAQIDAMLGGALAIANDDNKRKNAERIDWLRKLRRILEIQESVVG